MRLFAPLLVLSIVSTASALDLRPLVVGSWIHVDLMQLEKSSAADGAMRAAATKRLDAWAQGPHADYTLGILWSEVARRHESDPNLAKQLEKVLALGFPYAVPSSLDDVYRALWDERYLRQLMLRPGNPVARTVEVAQSLRDFLKEESAALRELRKEDHPAEKARIEKRLEKLGYKLFHVSPHLSFGDGSAFYGLRVEADESHAWLPSQPLRAANEDIDQAMQLLRVTPRPETPNATVPLWNATVLEKDGEFSLRAEASDARDFRGFLRARYAPPSGEDETTWNQRLAGWQPKAVRTMVKEVPIPLGKALK